ncbi:N-acetylmuramoyl-L-alanine amidase [Candidatus Saccharibacteria bacterium]|nr:N-acetylmuramoyl-L-alanine amidase [Candidatus Saccharibacteria bacterium]
MIDEMINYRYNDKTEQAKLLTKDQVLASSNPREMFLYLLYVNAEELDSIGEAILSTGNMTYVHYLLRSFRIADYKKYLPKIMCSNDPRYLFNILYDVDYLDELSRLKIIKQIIEINDVKYTFKAVYYYFIVLSLFNEELFLYIKNLLKVEKAIEINDSNYKKILNEIFYREDYKKDPDGFTTNCYNGRNGHIPNLIVCHINHTYFSAINRFYDKESLVSSHYVIRRDGHTKQVVKLDDSAWANGTSLDPSKDNYHRFATSEIIRNTNDNANYFSFSIEHESFDGSLTNAQFDATIMAMQKIITYLKNKYNYRFRIDRQHILGHNEVNPITRKKCPGEKFPFDKIIQTLEKLNA